MCGIAWWSNGVKFRVPWHTHLLIGVLSRGGGGGLGVLTAGSKTVVEPGGVAGEELQEKPQEAVRERGQAHLPAAALLQALHQGSAGLQRQACGCLRTRLGLCSGGCGGRKAGLKRACNLLQAIRQLRFQAGAEFVQAHC